VAAAFEDSFGGPLTAAAVNYDEAARLPRSGEESPRWEQGDAARRLHGAARAVASAGRSDRAAGMEPIAALVTLTGSVARLHAAHSRRDQARAADAAQQQVPHLARQPSRPGWLPVVQRKDQRWHNRPQGRRRRSITAGSRRPAGLELAGVYVGLDMVARK